MKDVKLLKSWGEDLQLIANAIRERAASRSPLEILEAGCGKYWPIDIDGIQFKLTGVDIDGRAVELRQAEFDDLNEIVIGDLRSINLGNAKYDVIYSSYVLEHIDGAQRVLDNFLNWLKP